MIISYSNTDLRDICYSLKPKPEDIPFTVDETKIIRSMISDLRAAPDLSQAPLNKRLNYDGQAIKTFAVKSSNIVIECAVISKRDVTIENEIMRAKITGIDLTSPNYK